jgi:formylglycine-generating enzyme required for sulfatase activity
MFDEEPPSIDPAQEELIKKRELEAASAGETIAHLLEEMDRQGYQARICELPDLEMLLIPACNFIYGSEDGEGSKARHSENIESFYLSRFPVTNAQYEMFLDETQYEPPYFWKDKRFSDPKRPVVGVPWEDALAFCEWLSDKTGSFYRLPLEVEWEKAARGLDGRPYPWGYEEPSAKYCRLSKDIANTERVGSHPDGASPFGCEDMLANVWQWCADAVVDEECQAAEAAKQLKPLDFRVCRGGSRGHVGDYLKCASRDYPIFRLIPLGFRVARSIGKPARCFVRGSA